MTPWWIASDMMTNSTPDANANKWLTNFQNEPQSMPDLSLPKWSSISQDTPRCLSLCRRDDHCLHHHLHDAPPTRDDWTRNSPHQQPRCWPSTNSQTAQEDQTALCIIARRLTPRPFTKIQKHYKILQNPFYKKYKILQSTYYKKYKILQNLSTKSIKFYKIPKTGTDQLSHKTQQNHIKIVKIITSW